MNTSKQFPPPEKSSPTSNPQTRSALQVSLSMLVAMVFIATTSYMTNAPFVIWEQWVSNNLAVVVALAALICAWLSWRRRPETGMKLLITVFLAVIFSLPLFVAGLGILMGISAFAVATAMAALTLSERQTMRVMRISFLIGIIIIVVDRIGSPDRLGVPGNLQQVTLIASVLITAIFGFLILRRIAAYRFWRRLSIPAKLILSFGLLLVIGVGVAGVGLLGLNQTQKSYEQALESTGTGIEGLAREMSITLLEARRSEKDFLLKWKTEGFETAYTNYVLPNQASTARIIEITADLLLSIQNSPEEESTQLLLEQIQSKFFLLQTPLEFYRQDFTVLVGLIEQRGHEDTGLEGEFRDVVHNIESQIYDREGLEDLVITMLQLRSREKDYLLRGEQQYVDNVHVLVDQLKSQIAASDRLAEVEKTQLAQLADDYLVKFDALVALDAQIAEKTATIQAAQQEIEPLLADIADLGIQKTSEDVSQAQAETRQTFFAVTGGLVIVMFIGLGLAVVMTRQIASPITSLTGIAERVRGGDLNVTAPVESEDEIGTLSATFNEMTAQVRELVNTLEKRVAERTRALTASAEVSRRLSTILDPDQLVLEVVEQIKAAYNYYHGQIYLLDDSGQTLVLAGATGEMGRTLLERGHRIPIERGLVGRVARTKTGVFVPDTSKEPDWLPNPLLPDTKAEVTVPIILGDRVIGVLDMQDNVTDDVFPEDVELLQAIANQVAIALQNARQYEETQVLFQASQALAAANGYQEMLNVFMKYAAPQSDQGGLLVFSASDEGELMAVDYAAAWSRLLDPLYSTLSQSIEVGTRFAPEQIPFIPFLAQGLPLIIADTHATTPGPQTATQVAEVLTQFGVQSVAGFPLIQSGKLLGALLFGYSRPHTFTERELQPVQTLASQLAILLQNQQLFAETQAALAQLDIINRRLTGEGWREFTKLIGGLTVEDVTPGLRVETVNGDSPFPVEIMVPIAVRGEEIGLFRLQQIEPDLSFTDDDLALLQEVADEVAVALENIRLLQETQQNAIALEESHNLLDSVIENLPMLLFVKEAQELRYVRWNKAGEKMLGISAMEVLGKNAYDSFSKEEADRFTAQDWEILSGEKFLDIAEETVEAPHGTRILHTLKTPVFGPDGQPKYLVGLSEDITERKQAENALQDLEALYRRAIAAADAVPYSRNYQDETFSFVGERIETLTGYEADEFTAAIFDSIILETIIYSEDGNTRSDAVRMVRTGQTSNWRADYRIRAKDGQERWLSDTSVEILGPERVSTGSVGILTDITERKRVEQSLNRQLVEMENLNAIGQILVTQTDLTEMLVQAGRKICEVFNVDTGYIALYEPRSEILNIPFYLDSGNQVEIEPKRLGVGLVSRVIRSRQPLFIPVMTEELSREMGAYLVGGITPASWLGVPVISGAEVIGVVSVQHQEQPNWFKERDVRYLSTIASSLSTAIQNIRLLEQTRVTLGEMEQLTRRLTRQGWQTYRETQTAETGYEYDLYQVVPMGPEKQENGNALYERPLVVQGETIGRLGVSETDELNEEAAELLSAVSHQLSAHLENLRLTEQTQAALVETEQRAAELEAINRIVAAATASLDLKAILRITARQVVDLLNARSCGIAQFDSSRQFLHVIADYDREVDGPSAEGAVIPVAGNLATIQALETKRSVMVVNAKTNPLTAPIHHLMIERDTECLLIMPLIVRGEVVGTIGVDSSVPGKGFTPAEVKLTETIAGQLAGAIENIRLFEETQQRAAELATVAEVSTTAATELNPDELLHRVVDLTKESFGLYHAHIYLLNEAQDTLVLTAGAGEVGTQMIKQGWTIPVDRPQSLVARALRTRVGVVANNVLEEPDYLPNPFLPDTRAELAVPLIVADQALGVLDVQLDKMKSFTQADILIYTTLASQVAVALQNARLYVEQAATVQRLRELDHLKSSFLANMSHELRTPLNSIIGFTEIILEGIDGPLTEYMDGDLKIIQKNGKHLLSLINDVLDMAKIEAGRMSLTYERFMLSELLEDVVDITTSLAHDKKIYLRIEGEGVNETELVADRIRLRQVLINLVGNAVKFTEKGGVTLRSEKKDGNLWIQVIDSGIGIPPHQLETVFDHFSQVDTSTTRKAGGTGLGLPISRRLVELHQGRLWAESTGVQGEGSAFILAIPIEHSPI